MKKAVLAISLVLIFTGCDSNADKSPPEKETPTIKDFVLTYSAPWDYNSIPWNTTILNADTVFVINSGEEFVKYFPTATSKPDNFTDYSLLFVYGKTTNKIVETSHNIVPETDGVYSLDVDIELAAEQRPDVWYVSILVPKIPNVIIPYKKMQGQRPDTVVRIENLQTRLRLIIDPKAIPEEIWRADSKNVIVYYRNGGIYFGYDADDIGYVNADDKTHLCEVINFPESAKQWEAEFVHPTTLGTVKEINIQMSGTVRLYTDEKEKKYGTLELTSLEPTVPESDEPVELQSGVYIETYPNPGNTRIEFIDKEKMNMTKGYNTDRLFSAWYKYEILEREHAIILANDVIPEHTLFFRVMNNSKFELQFDGPITAEKSGWIIMTFERE